MNTYVDMDQYAIQDNNAGVNCYTVLGDIDGALYYFRRALSAKLASEQPLLATVEASGEKTLHTILIHIRFLWKYLPL